VVVPEKEIVHVESKPPTGRRGNLKVKLTEAGRE
jgi:hypothetical protein